jgi:hypothetical protein
VNGDGVIGLVEKYAMVANPQPEQAFELALAVSPFQPLPPHIGGWHARYSKRSSAQSHGSPPARSDKIESSSRNLVVFVFPHLVLREAACGNDLLERNTLIALPEILARGGNCSAVFIRQFIVFVVNHHLKQFPDGLKL